MDVLSCNSQIGFDFKQIHDIAPGDNAHEFPVFNHRHMLDIAGDHPGERVAGIIRHIVEVQKFSTGELCRPDTDFARVPIRELVEKHAAEAHTGGDKEELIGSLRSTMESVEATLRAFGEEALKERVQYGKAMPKLDILYLYITHEMYHRGQITVYERLLQIEPAATAKVRELLAAQG